MDATRGVKLFGTDEPIGETRPLRAGNLTATLDAGNLRYITIGGVEALRAVAFLVRDRNWGTCNPEITGLQVEEDAAGFRVSYEARCGNASEGFRYRARIEGRPDGTLVFEADGEAETDFVTNRTGFVVLHPLDGVVDRPLTIEHTDGTVEESRFPALISPDCPFRDVRTLSSEIAPGLRLSCRMEAETGFEMEDHRNWMDASFKTYVRPLALPWPYTLARGERTRQRVTVSLSRPPEAPAITGRGGVAVSVGGPTEGRMPRLGLAAPAEHTEAALGRVDLLRAARPAFLVCHFDPRAGHDSGTIAGYRALGEAVGAPLVLEAVVPCQDAAGRPINDVSVLRRDLARIAEAARGTTFERVAVSPAADLKSTTPGGVYPPAPAWEDVASAAREAFPGMAVGGGMFSYFTELNRKRPPQGLFDFVGHSGAPIVHAGDDVSVMETLEALPSIFMSARAIIGEASYWVFPTAVSMRFNPYGAAPAENPRNIRQAMNHADPRDRGLLGAAWYSGFMAHAARAGLDAVTLAATAGPSGIVSTRQDHARPWFDDAPDARAMPSYFAFAAHARLAGETVLDATSSRPREVEVLATAGPNGRTVVLTNLSGATIDVALDGLGAAANVTVLDESSWVGFCHAPESLAANPLRGGWLTLAPYAIARIEAAP